MSVSLLPPDLRRIFAELERRVGILERRVKPVATQTAPPAETRLWATTGINIGSDLPAITLELTPFPLVAVGSGPYSVASGASRFYPQIDAPTYTTGGPLTVTAVLMVWTPDLTQRIRARWASVTIDSGEIWVPTNETVTTSMTIGTDLYIDANSRIGTSNAGTFLAHLHAQFSNIPTG